VPALVRPDEVPRLAALTARPVSGLRRLLHRDRSSLDLTIASLPTAAGRRVREARLPGVFVVPDTHRRYPQGTSLGPILGWTGVATPVEMKRWPDLPLGAVVGRTGLEQMYDPILRGTDGRQCVYVTPAGTPVALGPYTAPRRGSTVGLTLDMGLQRKLTVEQAAKRAALWPEQVEWLEEGKLYRFPRHDTAVLALLRYATALGIDHREALELAGLPAPPLPTSPRRRIIALAAFLAVVAAAILAVVLAQGGTKPKSPAAASASALPAPWAVKVVVLNGSGDIVYTRSIASRVQALSYRVTHVGRATSFTYLQTVVYYPPGGEPVCTRLAQQLEVPVQPLPGGTDSRRCVVIVGPERGPGN